MKGRKKELTLIQFFGNAMNGEYSCQIKKNIKPHKLCRNTRENKSFKIYKKNLFNILNVS
jgi:hypothetical protein